MKNKFIFLLLLLLISTRSVFAKCDDLAKLDQLYGHWQTEKQESITQEIWQRVSEKTIEGVGRTIRPDGRQSEETLRIVEMSGEIFYLAKVKSNPLPIAFKLMGCERSQLLFQNAQHDFPQQLQYTFIQPNRLDVLVSDINGDGFTIHFKRINSTE